MDCATGTGIPAYQYSSENAARLLQETQQCNALVPINKALVFLKLVALKLAVSPSLLL